MGGRVTLKPPRHDTFAANFLQKTRFFQRAAALGCEVGGGADTLEFPKFKGVAAFETFGTAGELKTYCEALADHRQLRLLISGDIPPEIISTGQFRRTVLFELADNTFTHAAGRNSHFAAFQALEKQEERQQHPLIATFGAQGYVEIAVGDSGTNNIIDTLRPYLPGDFSEPRKLRVLGGKLTKDDKTLLFAFEFDSTSNAAAREAKVRAYLENGGDDVRGVATGLYENLWLAHLYNGQILARVAGRILSVDYSMCRSPEDEPKFTVLKKVRGQQLANLEGSIVALRVPVTRQLSANTLRPSSVEHTTEKDVSVRNVMVRLGATGRVSAADLIAGTGLLRKTLADPSSRRSVVVVHLTDTQLPLKVLSAYLRLIVRLPRGGRGLLVMLDDENTVRLLSEEWQRLVVERDLHLRPDVLAPSLVVAANQTTVATIFGATDYMEATSATSGALHLPWGHTVPLQVILEKSLSQILAQSLEAPSTRHTGGFYLIERRYYVGTFYEVRRLDKDPWLRRLLQKWILIRLDEARPSVIVSNATFLELILRDALAKWT